jgi:hypothetical protein
MCDRRSGVQPAIRPCPPWCCGCALFAEPASSQLFNDQLDEVADAAAAIPSAEVKSKHQPRRAQRIAVASSALGSDVVGTVDCRGSLGLRALR